MRRLRHVGTLLLRLSPFHPAIGVSCMLGLLKRLKNKVMPEAVPALADDERRRDRVGGVPSLDPGREAVVAAGLAWLCLAQDQSATADGGVARNFSLLRGWASSYPETTGYIIPTMIELATRRGDPAP